jgi:hypothetical protein
VESERGLSTNLGLVGHPRQALFHVKHGENKAIMSWPFHVEHVA